MTIADVVVQTEDSSELLSPEERRANLDAEKAGPNAAAQAFTAYSALVAPIQAAANAVALANFGRIVIADSCTYHCGFEKWTWSASFDGRSALPFPSTLQQMDSGAQFSTAFNSVKAVLASFAATGAQLDKQIATIKTIDAAIVKADGKATAQQLLDLNKAFEIANGAVSQSKTENDTALQTLSSFESAHTVYKGALQSQVASTEASFDKTITNMRNGLIAEAKCGISTITSEFADMLAIINASFASLAPSFSAANIAFEIALTKTTLVIGNVLALQSSYVAVLDALAAAKADDPTSILRTVKLDIASQTWTDLVSYAQANLAT